MDCRKLRNDNPKSSLDVTEVELITLVINLPDLRSDLVVPR